MNFLIRKYSAKTLSHRQKVNYGSIPSDCIDRCEKIQKIFIKQSEAFKIIFFLVVFCDGIYGQTWRSIWPENKFYKSQSTSGPGECCESKMEYDLKYGGTIKGLYMLSKTVNDTVKAGCKDQCVYIK